MPILSPASGVIEEILVEDGETVTPGQLILKIKVGAAGAVSEKKPQESKAPAPAASPATPPPPKPAASSPPSRPKPVIEKIPVSSIKPATPAASSELMEGARTEQRVKINRMRHRIAQRLKDAQNTYAMLTTFNEIDMSYV